MDQEDVTQGQTFEGFVPPVSNYFRMPNGWINICAKINNLAELKVVQYVLRHTWGYREYDGTPKPITVDEFMHGRKRGDGTRMDDGTGLSKPSVIQGLKYAIKHGYLTCETDDTDKARVIKSYALKMSASSEVKDLNPANRGKGSLPRESRSFTPVVKDLDIQGVKNLDSDQRKTEERNLKKDTKERKNDAPDNPTTPETSFSHPSIPSQSSSEVLFSEEESQVLSYAKKLRLSYLSKNEKNKAHCSKLVSEGVISLEQVKSLMQFCKQRPYLKDKDLNLGNLVSEVDGWLQLQKQPDPEPSRPSFLVSDEQKQRNIAKLRARAQQKEGVAL